MKCNYNNKKGKPVSMNEACAKVVYFGARTSAQSLRDMRPQGSGIRASVVGNHIIPSTSSQKLRACVE